MHVIVIAHGPTPVSKRAVRRLRRFRVVDEVWIVAATERSERLVAGIAGATPVSGVGTVAVDRLVAELGSDPVLLVHDDVAVSEAGLRKMLEVLGSGADFVAPHNNEVGTPQFAGPLPPAGEALPVLDGVSGLGGPRRLASARYSCLLGTGSSFAALTGTFVVPGASLVRSEVMVMLAPVAVAHDLSCHGRLVEDDPGCPVLVASMIVRDEERHIADAIRSVQGLVDRVEICDTGSVDDTVRIAESLGANVRSIAWRDDFGWARNEALESCRDAEFFLVLDADERVVVDEPALFRRWLRTWRHELSGVLVELRNHRGEGLPYSTHRAMRVASTDGSRWHGALHESVRFDGDPSAAVVFYAGLAIDHLGYSSAVVAEKGKARRNIEISRAAFEAHRDPKTMIDYARSLRMEDDDDPLAESLFRQALAEVPEGVPGVVRSYLLATVAAYEMTAGRAAEAGRLALDALELTPFEDVAQVTLAKALSDAGDWAGLVDVWEDVTSRPSATPMFGIELNRHRFEVHVARALSGLGRHDEAAAVIAKVMAGTTRAIADSVEEVVPAMLADGLEPLLLVPALIVDRHAVVIGALARSTEPPAVARAAAEALDAGARHAALFTTGFAASLIRPGSDLPDRLITHADLAPRDHRPALAEMAARRGRPDLAERFQDAIPQPLVLSGELFK